MIPFTQFVQLMAEEPDNHHAIINRAGAIIIINGRRGHYRYDTIADFLRARATPVAQTSESAGARVETPQPLQPS